MNKKKKIYTAQFEVRWDDLDALDHLNHAKMFVYLQEVRIKWLAEFKQTVSLDEKQGPVILQASCDYFCPIVYPDQLTIDVFLEELGRTSLTLSYDIYSQAQADKVAAQARTKVVWVDYDLNQSTPLPVALRQVLEAIS